MDARQDAKRCARRMDWSAQNCANVKTVKLSSMKTLNLLVKMLCWKKRALNRLNTDLKLTDFLAPVCEWPFSYNHSQKLTSFSTININVDTRLCDSRVWFYEPERHFTLRSLSYYQLIKYSWNFVKPLMAFITIMLPILIEKAIVVSELLLFIVK